MKNLKISILTIFPLLLVIIFFYIANVDAFMCSAYTGGQWWTWIVWPSILIGSIGYVFSVTKLWTQRISTGIFLVLIYLTLLFYQNFHLYFRYDTRIIGVSVLVSLWISLQIIDVSRCIIVNKKNSRSLL